MDKEINIDEIMAEIRADIKNRGLEDTLYPFSKVSFRKDRIRFNLLGKFLEFAYKKVFLKLPVGVQKLIKHICGRD